MKSLPRILVIDDVYGRPHSPHNHDREMFCARLGLNDLGGKPGRPATGEEVADAVLTSGQVTAGDRVDNDLDGVLATLRAGWRDWPRWALVLLDMHFQTGAVDPASGEPLGEPEDRDPRHYFGLRILERILEDEDLRLLPIVILSSMERERIESRFARRGVSAFVEKDRLNRDGLRGLLWENGLLEDERIVGRSLALLRALREARRAARAPGANILLLGETGTGKELLAEYIHRVSGREGPFRRLFVRANDDLFAADLFGYVKGAFTGALRDRPGEAELADRGTLFFDEFGDIPPGAQDKLMRLLDRSLRESQRIGDTTGRRLDLQVVMATNRFGILVTGFRRDLLQRANAAHPVILPPLREREEDIPLLAEMFVRRHEETLHAERREISPEAVAILKAHTWPGNVRELEQELAEAVASYRGIRCLSPDHLLDLQVGPRTAAPPALPSSVTPPLPAAAPPRAETVPPRADAASSVSASASGRPGIESLHKDLALVRFDMDDREQWLGRLGPVQAEYARFLARYLNAALEASALASGSPRPTTAVRMLLGRASLRTSDAASIVKRLLSVSRESIGDLLADETLHLGRTLQWAENLRGSAGSTGRPEKRDPGRRQNG